MKKFYLIIKGNVQGVFFRHNTKKKADSLGLTGTVKNLESGEVEVVVQGEEEKLDLFFEWCKKGPSVAMVDSIEKRELIPGEILKNFEMVY